MAPNIGLIIVEPHVLIHVLRTRVPVSAITPNTSVLEVQSFITGNACVKLRLEPDDSNLFVFTSTIFVFTPAPDLEKVFTRWNILQIRVPFKFVIRVFKAYSAWLCAFIVQFVGHYGIYFIDDDTIGGFMANMADTCGKGAIRSLNQLLLYGLDLGPIRAVRSLVKGCQAILHGLAQEVPRVGRL